MKRLTLFNRLDDTVYLVEWWKKAADLLESHLQTDLAELGVYKDEPHEEGEWLDHCRELDDPLLNPAVAERYQRSRKLLETAIIDCYVAHVLHFHLTAAEARKR